MAINICRDKYTALPTLLAIQAKGYKLNLIYTKKDHDLENLDVMTRINNLTEIYIAEKDENHFSANDPEQLLGLITMWEMRGNNWEYDMDVEQDIQEDLINNSVVYDLEGNLIEGKIIED